LSLPPEIAPPGQEPQAGSLKEGEDIKALAKGGRTNFFGFLLRLAARLPFLFIAGRVYGAEALGRFAYAIIIVEFVATLATLGLKRGLAEQLSATDRPHVHVVWDALLVGAIASAVAAVILGMLPEIMFPNSGINGLEWLLPLTIFALAWSDISLAALAYRLDIGATVRARSIIEPWTISIAAFALSYYSLRDGLIMSYVVSMGAALVASIWPLMKSFGWPHGWRPRPTTLFLLAKRNVPLAAADAIEWGSRRLDIAILGLFFSPTIVGIYYVAQQVASLPQKLKTSFDPILGPFGFDLVQGPVDDRLGCGLDAGRLLVTVEPDQPVVLAFGRSGGFLLLVRRVFHRLWLGGRCRLSSGLGSRSLGLNLRPGLGRWLLLPRRRKRPFLGKGDAVHGQEFSEVVDQLRRLRHLVGDRWLLLRQLHLLPIGAQGCPFGTEERRTWIDGARQGVSDALDGKSWNILFGVGGQLISPFF